MYEKIQKIDGRHPLQEAVPESCLMYKARVLPNGKVLYFNFTLAKEMGLIAKNHPHTLNKKLQAILLKTFHLCIINEYDELFLSVK